MPATSVFWTAAEEDAFVDFLVDHKAEAGDGGGFKGTTYQSALKLIAPLRSRGAVKTVKALQNKWAAFKKVHRIIRAIQDVSGWVWDDTTGASITADSASSWDDYVKKYPESKPYRNKGWRHFGKVSLIMPSTAAGANVFHPTAAPDDTSASTPSSTETSPEPETQATQDVEESDGAEDKAPSAGPSLRKRAREAAAPSRPGAKRVRASQGATALQSMSTTLANFSTTFSAALAPPPGLPPSPVRRSTAIAALQSQDSSWLTVPQQVALIDLLRVDRTAADIYCALKESGLRREWVRTQLEKLNIFVYTRSPSPSL